MSTVLKAPGTRSVTTEALPQISDVGKIPPKDARALSKPSFDQLQVLKEGTHEYQ